MLAFAGSVSAASNWWISDAPYRRWPPGVRIDPIRPDSPPSHGFLAPPGTASDFGGHQQSFCVFVQVRCLRPKSVRFGDWITDIDTVSHLTIIHGRDRLARTPDDPNYIRGGDIVGTATVFAGQLLNTGVQAVVDSSVLVLRPQTVLGLAATDVGLANVLSHDLTERAAAYISASASTTLSSSRQNVIRHLLDLPVPDPGGNVPVVRLSQRALAEHVGTVRDRRGQRAGRCWSSTPRMSVSVGRRAVGEVCGATRRRFKRRRGVG